MRESTDNHQNWQKISQFLGVGLCSLLSFFRLCNLCSQSNDTESTWHQTFFLQFSLRNFPTKETNLHKSIKKQFPLPRSIYTMLPKSTWLCCRPLKTTVAIWHVYLYRRVGRLLHTGFRSLVVMTPASHAGGPRFDPERKQCFSFFLSFFLFFNSMKLSAGQEHRDGEGESKYDTIFFLRNKAKKK